jgi:hypothetical protein
LRPFLFVVYSSNLEFEGHTDIDIILVASVNKLSFDTESIGEEITRTDGFTVGEIPTSMARIRSITIIINTFVNLGANGKKLGWNFREA